MEERLKIRYDNLFIVRVKDGYAVLPSKRGKGATTVELSTTKPPRLFASRGAAANAIRWWKAGLASQAWSHPTFAFPSEPDGIESLHLPERDEVELEIVPVTLEED